MGTDEQPEEGQFAGGPGEVRVMPDTPQDQLPERLAAEAAQKFLYMTAPVIRDEGMSAWTDQGKDVLARHMVRMIAGLVAERSKGEALAAAVREVFMAMTWNEMTDGLTAALARYEAPHPEEGA